MLTVFPIDPGNEPASRLAAVAALMAIWWITEAIPLFATALLPLVFFPLLGIMPGKEIAPSYINSTIVLFIGGFMIALTMQRWNLHRRIALNIIRLVGGGPTRIVLGFMIAAAFLSMWISNTATAITVLPMGLAIVLQVEEQMGADDPGAHKFAVGLMLGIGYGCSVGGMTTLVGTPPNLSLVRIFEILFPEGPEIAFGQWMIVALPVGIVMLTVAWLLITRVLYRAPSDVKVESSVVERELARLGPITFEERAVLAVFAGAALLWVFRVDLTLGAFTLPGWSGLLPWPRFVDDGTVAITMASLLFFIPGRDADGKRTRLMGLEVIPRLPWNVVLLIGGGFALAAAFVQTGLAQLIGGQFAAAGRTADLCPDPARVPRPHLPHGTDQQHRDDGDDPADPGLRGGGHRHAPPDAHDPGDDVGLVRVHDARRHPAERDRLRQQPADHRRNGPCRHLPQPDRYPGDRHRGLHDRPRGVRNRTGCGPRLGTYLGGWRSLTMPTQFTQRLPFSEPANGGMNSKIPPSAAFLLAILANTGTAVGAESDSAEPESTQPNTTDVPCSQAIERSTSLNGMELFKSAETCSREERVDDAVFLLFAGQVRAMTDMSILEARSEPDEDAAGELYGALYFRYGGSGSDDMYRDADRIAGILKRLRSWRPSLPASYDPGWNYERPVDRDRYQSMADYGVRHRLAQLETYRNLIQDDRYFAIQQERGEIRARNNTGTVAGTEDADRLKELDRMQAAIRSSIPTVPAPPLPRELQPDYSPNPDADFVELHKGFNGIEEETGPSVDIFESRTDALDSWLGRVIAPVDLQQLLDEVDFHRQTIVAMRFPPVDAANGKVYIRDIDYRASSQYMGVYGIVGLNTPDCKEPKARSYPFVVVASPRPDFEVESHGASMATLVEGCRPPMGAETRSDPNRHADPSDAPGT